MARTDKNKDDVVPDHSWVHELAKAVIEENKPPPPEYITAAQVSEETGVSQGHARKLLHQGVKSGRLETKKFRIQSGDRLYPVALYRPKEK